MQLDAMERFEARCQKLERTVARLRITCATCCVVALSVLVMGQVDAQRGGGTPRVLRAKQFEVVDKGGKVVVAMTSVNGKGVIVTRSSEGKRLVELAATVDGQGAITLRNAKGDRVVTLGALASGEGFVTTLDGRNNEMVNISAVNRHGTITTKNPEGRAMAKITVTNRGDGQIITESNTGQKLVEFGGTSDGIGGALAVFNQDGAAICTMKPDSEGYGVVGAWDNLGIGNALKAR